MQHGEDAEGAMRELSGQEAASHTAVSCTGDTSSSHNMSQCSPTCDGGLAQTVHACEKVVLQKTVGRIGFKDRRQVEVDASDVGCDRGVVLVTYCSLLTGREVLAVKQL